MWICKPFIKYWENIIKIFSVKHDLLQIICDQFLPVKAFISFFKVFRETLLLTVTKT